MSTEKNMNVRIQHKHDIESNWIKALNFIPKAGEIIIYDPDDNYDYARIKIGDGLTLVNELKFFEIQPDWDISDENNPAYIKNRPFYETEPTENYIINNEEITSKTYNAEGLLSYATFQTFSRNTKLISDNIYTVKINENIYTCVAYRNKYDYNCTMLGNYSFHSDSFENTGESFCIVQNERENSFGIYLEGSGGTYNVSIYSIEPIVTQIPNKFLGLNIHNGEGYKSIVEGNYTIASGYASHAEGYTTVASGEYSHAEGWGATALDVSAHAEGSGTYAAGVNAHAEGQSTIASSYNTHAEGMYAMANSFGSHAEGYHTIASGEYSHAEGEGRWIGYVHIAGKAGDTTYSIKTETSAKIVPGMSVYKSIVFDNYWNYTYRRQIVAYDEQNQTLTLDYPLSYSEDIDEEVGLVYGGIVSGSSSHGEGEGTIANSKAQHSQGRYNIPDSANGGWEYGNYAHIVGNGESPENLSNAHTLDWDGNAWFSGDVYVGSTSGTNKDEGSKKLVTTDEMNTAIEAALANINNAEEVSF